MPRIPKRTIAFYPNLKDSPWIEEVRLEFDPLANKTPPHITLVFPFYSCLSLKRLKQHLKKSPLNLLPFEVEISEVRMCPDNSVWLMVNQGELQCRAFHEFLYTSILGEHYNPQFPYLPHITIGSSLVTQDAIKLVKTVEEKYLPCRLPIEFVGVEIIDESGQGTIELRLYPITE